ncbi:MAG TPA: hypothetical protein VN231_06835 [Allosphingosinicella sp.]|nr:hypothetical protein [Allosphingosinicella sp.]
MLEMQRVRIGLTGLAFVFLAVLLAAVFTGEPSGEAPITPNLIEQERAGRPVLPAAGNGPATPTEPLAELGVAPGNAESNTAAPGAAPPVAATPAR